MLRKRILCLFAAAACLLCGCSVQTVDQLYCLPKRSEAYHSLQTAIDSVMEDMEYCAPISGENQQTVQTADLDGDGAEEYLLFAKGGSDKPLRILVFRRQEENFVLDQTIESTGLAFDRVEYVQMDGEPGLELVVGRRVSDQLLGSVSVYTFAEGQAKQLVATNYTKFLVCDLDTDARAEVMVIQPGQTEMDHGIVSLYSVKNGTVERSAEASLSGTVNQLKRIITGKLHGGMPAVFVASTVEESAIITDVYALVDGSFTNVSYSSETGTSVHTLRNYYVYAEDIDGDGEVELPDLITMTPLQNGRSTDEQYLIRWYSMKKDGTKVVKMYTYHNYVGGWYLKLDGTWASRLSVRQTSEGYEFYLWDSRYTSAQQIFTVYPLTGQDREEQGSRDNRFVLYQNDSTVYAARLETAADTISITREGLTSAFCLIRQDWKTGEM